MLEYENIGEDQSPDGTVPQHAIERLRKLGWSWAAIGREFGRSRQAMWLRGQVYDTPPLDHEAVRREHFPWVVEGNFVNSGIYKDMSRHGRFAVTAGEGMTENAVERVMSFHKRLRDKDLVVEFDPNIPPGLRDRIGGFAYRKRKASDNGLIVRNNKYTTITELGHDIWRLPPYEPR